MRPIATLVVGALALAAARPAAADDTLIGLLEVRVEGVSDTAAGLFAQQIEESLGMAGYKVASAARLREFLTTSPWNAACLAGGCLAVLKTHAGVDRILEARMVASGPTYHFVITLVDTATGEVLAQKADRCEVCTTEEAIQDAGLAVVGLMQLGNDDVPAPPPPPPVRADRTRRTTRRLGLALLGAAAVAGAGSALLYSSDADRGGALSAGAAGAFAVAGVTSLGISFAF